ncbi:unnamed protein product [Schistosoma rodhaini]|uniref:NPP n=1 Tax=Schistosoma rodhaini TaxID=6188 RepID=A0A183QSD8_9TREM|nr:unnamed protein product [Schistosoma rodhaini]CAH8598626.1 unnamed protein product [Schistosoma rodhaini]
MKRYSLLRIIQLFISYQIFCLLFICAHGSSRCTTTVNSDGLPILTCDHDRLKAQSHFDIYDDEQNELIPESDYPNDPLQSQQSAEYIMPSKKAFVRLGKRGFVRIGKRGFVRIGR